MLRRWLPRGTAMSLRRIPDAAPSIHAGMSEVSALSAIVQSRGVAHGRPRQGPCRICVSTTQMMPDSRMHRNQNATLSFGIKRLSTSPCMIGGANNAKTMIASSPLAISVGCSALREICLPKAVAEIEVRMGPSAATSTQASQMVQVTGRRRWEGTVFEILRQSMSLPVVRRIASLRSQWRDKVRQRPAFPVQAFMIYRAAAAAALPVQRIGRRRIAGCTLREIWVVPVTADSANGLSLVYRRL